MPFKLFNIHKKVNTEKSSSISTTDLSDRKSEEPPDVDTKVHPKSKLHFFSSGKIHVHFKSIHGDKEKKGKNTSKSSLPKRTQSLSHIPSIDTSSTAILGNNEQGCLANNQCATTNGPPRKASSYGTFMDNLSRERRQLEIAQLDNYMEYLRHTEDEGNMASRLCCAQVLKMSLLMLEQRRLNSHERIDVCHKGPTSRSPQIGSNGIQKRLNDKAGSSNSQQPEDKQNENPAGVVFGLDSDGRESEHDSSSEQDSEGSCHNRNNIKKHKLSVKSNRIPVWPRDIEIF